MYTGSAKYGMWEWAAPAAPGRVGAGRCAMGRAPLQCIECAVAQGDADENGSRPQPGVESGHPFGTAPTYPATHAACAVGHEWNESVCETRIRQPSWEHQRPRRLLDPC